MLSQTLGTALGDWVADSAGPGYLGAAMIFVGLLLLIIIVFYWTKISRTVLFWAAFVLTRPLGAVVGDYLDKPIAAGGLDFNRYSASALLLMSIIVCIVIFPQRAAHKLH